jgi:hypothetical protein
MLTLTFDTASVDKNLLPGAERVRFGSSRQPEIGNDDRFHERDIGGILMKAVLFEFRFSLKVGILSGSGQGGIAP